MRAFTPCRAALAAFGFAILSLGFGSAALGQSNSSAQAPHAAKAFAGERLRLAPGSAPATALDLGAPEPGAIEAIRHINTLAATKRLQIGIGRSTEGMAAARSAALQWVAVDGGMAAHWEISSQGARALRIGLVAEHLAPGTEIRFVGNRDAERVYGPFSATDLGAALYWSPVLEGDTATLEVFVGAGASPAGLSLAVRSLSHLFASPADPNVVKLAKAAQFCEVDLICRSASDPALASAGRSVARMIISTGTGGTGLCTGTLLNPSDGSFTPYFYSANHCIDTQAEASSLTTHWFYDAASCGSPSPNPANVQVPGGATLLYANASSDALLLRLNNAPPPGAVFAGWDAATLGFGTPLTAIHHPEGDLKKVSLGTMGGFGASSVLPDATGSFIIVNWNSIATGVTEKGSSGSGIFSGGGGGEYLFRGGLLGGPSSCSATAGNLYDDYSRLDQVYTFIAQYLSPASGTCNFSLSPASQAVASGAASGSFAVNVGAGCPWTAASSVPWITTSSSGTGSGTVDYSVAANPTSAARTGTIGVGGRTFTVTQAGLAVGGANLVANPGFENATAGWTQTATGGAPIITNDPATAHSGAWYAFLGGYDNGTDTISQDIAIPAGSGAAQLQFWYRISTTETTTSTAFDQLLVELASPASGATLATLATFSNLNATGGAWVQSPAYDVSAFRGQTVRLRFVATTEISNPTAFRIDDITLTAGAAPANYTALWWNPSESGWGINVNQQGDIVFATLFTYDASHNPLWLVMSKGDRQGSSETFSGILYRTTGPVFNSVPFNPAAVNNTPVGTMTLAFTGADTGSLSYTFNGAPVVKSIQKQVLVDQLATCVSTAGARTSATNYQDLWWNPAESGWGVNITHKDNIMFATLFTYAADGQGLWLFMSRGERQPDGSYLGELYRATGPAFDAVPFTPISPANLTQVGTMRLRFTDGNSGTLEYSVNGANVVKSITRQEFSSPRPICN